MLPPSEASTAAAAVSATPPSNAERLAATQKYQDAVSVYFARKVSRHLTPLFLALRISANNATAVWGLLSLFNSYVIYLAITGSYYLVPVIFAIYFLVVVVDCVDGEIARYRGTANPIGGKLLDALLALRDGAADIATQGNAARGRGHRQHASARDVTIHVHGESLPCARCISVDWMSNDRPRHQATPVSRI